MMMPAVHGGEAMYSSGMSTSRVAAIIVAIASAQIGCDGMIAADRVCIRCRSDEIRKVRSRSATWMS